MKSSSLDSIKFSTQDIQNIGTIKNGEPEQENKLNFRKTEGSGIGVGRMTGNNFPNILEENESPLDDEKENESFDEFTTFSKNLYVSDSVNFPNLRSEVKRPKLSHPSPLSPSNFLPTTMSHN